MKQDRLLELATDALPSPTALPTLGSVPLEPLYDGRVSVNAASSGARLGVGPNLSEAWREFLNRFRWDYFITATNRRSVAPRDFERLLTDRYLRRLAQAAQQPVAWVYGVEHGPHTRTHAHLLIATADRLPSRSVKSAWSFGIVDVRRYYPDGYGAAYVVKSITQPDAVVGISARWLPHA